MFSSRLLRLPPALRTISCIPRSSPAAFRKIPSISPLSARHYAYPPPPPPRRPQRVVHYRFDPEGAARAKPLITLDQINYTVSSPSFRYIILFAIGSGVVFYVANLETVPVSGRRRFNCYSEKTVEKEGEVMYRKIMAEAIRHGTLVSPRDRRSKMVERVLGRLVHSSGLENVPWEIHVLESPERNAFVIPGGKVFVYSGMFSICKNDDGLAAILGHEIAHNLAQHAAESMSSLIMLAPIRYSLIFLDATGYTMGLGRVLGDFALNLGIAMPASRKQESEADYIGLMMMAKACYDPHAAVGVWQRMEETMKAEEIPEWLSTHPSNLNRIDRMKEWLPKAEEARNESGCAATLGYAQDFQTVLGGMGSGLRGTFGDGFWR